LRGGRKTFAGIDRHHGPILPFHCIELIELIELIVGWLVGMATDVNVQIILPGLRDMFDIEQNSGAGRGKILGQTDPARVNASLLFFLRN
jgi:hypothetical protein